MDIALARFIDAQQNMYEAALAEIRAGEKRGHWMWYVFPQYKGLGFSEQSRFYAIQSLGEAREFLSHPVLGTRLREITNALLTLKENDAVKIFGSPDEMKLRSSMTLCSLADDSGDRLFLKVLEKFFNGVPDAETMRRVKE